MKFISTFGNENIVNLSEVACIFRTTKYDPYPPYGDRKHNRYENGIYMYVKAGEAYHVQPLFTESDFSSINWLRITMMPSWKPVSQLDMDISRERFINSVHQELKRCLLNVCTLVSMYDVVMKIFAARVSIGQAPDDSYVDNSCDDDQEYEQDSGDYSCGYE